MEYITKSLAAMSLAVVTALLYAIGTGCIVGAYASLTPTSLGTANDLANAGNWLQFVAGLAAVALVCTAGWELVLRRAWIGVWEILVAAAGTLLLTIGLLVAAISQQANSAAEILTAVGVGVWSLLVLLRAARSSLAEQRPASNPVQPDPVQPNPVQPNPEHQPGEAKGRPGEARLWLIAAVGLLVLAVGTGFTPSVENVGISTAAGILEAAGTVVLFAALAGAWLGKLLPSKTVPVMLIGVVVLAAGFTADAVVAGLVFGPDATLTALRVGLSVATTIVFVAVAVLGISAWKRVREIASRSHGTENLAVQPSTAP